jgi:hypothetical protein
LPILCYDLAITITIFIVQAGKFHDLGVAKWIVIRGQLRGHNDTPCGQPTPGRPPGGWPPAGRDWWFQLLLICDNIFQHCPLNMEFTDRPAHSLLGQLSVDSLFRICCYHERMARGGHGLLKVPLGPTVPDPFMPCWQAPLKQPYARFGGGESHTPARYTGNRFEMYVFRSRCLQDRRPAAVFYPLGHPTLYVCDR